MSLAFNTFCGQSKYILNFTLLALKLFILKSQVIFRLISSVIIFEATSYA